MATKDLDNFKLVEPGDFVIHLRSFQSGFELSQIKGIVSPAYTVFRLKEILNTNFYKYVFYSKPFIDYISSTTQSLRDGKPISFKDFGDMYLPVPPEQEQKKIADYFTRLDSKINEIENQLAELKGTRNSLISNVVTGRLNID
nr:restriction endonuclease subunit S [Paenibacillus sp. JNUCC-31]